MKRFHVHVTVYDIDSNVQFYSSLFGTAPTVLEPDYAEWIVEDPRVNFTISARGATPRVDHLGIQVSTDLELAGMRRKLARLDGCVTDEPRASSGATDVDCHWAIDPQGIVWETFCDSMSEPVGAPARAQKNSFTEC